MPPATQPKTPSSALPGWVAFALWGLNRRSAALFFVWLSLAIALGLLWVGVLPGVIYFGCAAWYWFAARWVDRHADWPLQRSAVHKAVG